MDLYVKPVSGAEDARSSSPRRIAKFLLTGRQTVAYWSFSRRAQANNLGSTPPLISATKAAVLVDSEFDEIQGRVSPDGRWLAYVSNETGTYEVFVRTFVPGAAASLTSTLVSVNGGSHPQWRRDGR